MRYGERPDKLAVGNDFHQRRTLMRDRFREGRFQLLRPGVDSGYPWP